MYAIRKDGKGWRSIADKSDVEYNEVYSKSQPDIIGPTIEEARANVEVSAFQAQAALARLGKYDAVVAIMNNAETPLEMSLAWNKAQTFKRLSPTVLAMSQLLKLSDVQLDDLFALAKTIEA
jgi:hypothetical protein